MQPVTAGAHICSSPGRCSQKRGGGEAREGQRRRKPRLTRSSWGPAGTLRGGRGPSAARLGLGARRLLGGCVSAPGAPAWVIDGPPGDRATGARDLPGGRVPGSEASGKACLTLLFDALSLPPPLSCKVVGLRSAGQGVDAGDQAARRGVRVWGSRGALRAPGAHKARASHPPTARSRPEGRRCRAPGAFPQAQGRVGMGPSRADWVHGEGPGGEG